MFARIVVLVYRLREIEMSDHDAEMYANVLGKVRNQIQALRTMLSSIEVHLPDQ